MPRLKVLSATWHDRDRWIAALDAMPSNCRDLHYHPDYLLIYHTTYDERVAALLYEDDEGCILQPVVIREIGNSGEYDMSSVYGFGGALASKELSREQVSDFQNCIEQWAKENNIISEYCVLHPYLSAFQKKLLPENIDLFYRKEIVSANLTSPLSQLWERIEDRQRKAILSARKKGITIEQSDGSREDYTSFHKRYLATMQKVQATEFWCVPEEFFWNCRVHLGAESTSLFHAKFEGETIASVFHVHLKPTVYYHYSCSSEAAQKLNPVPLLLFDSMLWAKSAGFDNFHLGGGYASAKDSLFYFKNAFCNNTESLYAYRRIFNKDRYEALSEEKIQLEIEELGAPKVTEFFPRYRA